MDDTIVTIKAQAIADILDGVDILAAVDIVEVAIGIAAKKDKDKCMIEVYIIAKLLIAAGGKRGIVELTDDGGVSFTIEADNGKELLKL